MLSIGDDFVVLKPLDEFGEGGDVPVFSRVARSLLETKTSACFKCCNSYWMSGLIQN